MPSRRGRFSHGRDKDEWFMRRYNAGWQAWWLFVVLVLCMALAAGAAALGVAVGTHHANYEDVHHSYDQGFRDGVASRREHDSDATSTTTTAPTVPEPSPARPGSGAPAADTPTSVVAPATPAPLAPVPFVQHTG